MPWDPRFRKPDVARCHGRAIEVVIETGDSGPMTAVGINLPNDQAIRERYGSKSVSLIECQRRLRAVDAAKPCEWSSPGARRRPNAP